jgi:hypothetical protein
MKLQLFSSNLQIYALCIKSNSLIFPATADTSLTTSSFLNRTILSPNADRERRAKQRQSPKRSEGDNTFSRLASFPE